MVMKMEEEYFVKISGANVVYTKIDTVKSMLRRLKRLKMELEDLKKESVEKKRLLVEQIKEATETIKFIEKHMPKSQINKKKFKDVEKLPEVKKGKTRGRVMRTKTEITKPKISHGTVRELSDLRSELEKLKKELEE
jgi:hypothetical protein